MSSRGVKDTDPAETGSNFSDLHLSDETADHTSTGDQANTASGSDSRASTELTKGDSTKQPDGAKGQITSGDPKGAAIPPKKDRGCCRRFLWLWIVIIVILIVVIVACLLLYFLNRSSKSTTVVIVDLRDKSGAPDGPTHKPRSSTTSSGISWRTSGGQRSSNGFASSVPPIPVTFYCAGLSYLNVPLSTTRIALLAESEALFLVDPLSSNNKESVTGTFSIESLTESAHVVLWMPLIYTVPASCPCEDPGSCESSVVVKTAKKGVYNTRFHCNTTIAGHGNTTISSRIEVSYKFDKELSDSYLMLFRAIGALQLKDENATCDGYFTKKCILKDGRFCIHRDVSCYGAHECTFSDGVISCGTPNQSRVIHILRKGSLPSVDIPHTDRDYSYLYPGTDVNVTLMPNRTSGDWNFRSPDSRIPLTFTAATGFQQLGTHDVDKCINSIEIFPGLECQPGINSTIFCEGISNSTEDNKGLEMKHHVLSIETSFHTDPRRSIFTIHNPRSAQDVVNGLAGKTCLSKTDGK